MEELKEQRVSEQRGEVKTSEVLENRVWLQPEWSALKASEKVRKPRGKGMARLGAEKKRRMAWMRRGRKWRRWRQQKVKGERVCTEVEQHWRVSTRACLSDGSSWVSGQEPLGNGDLTGVKVKGYLAKRSKALARGMRGPLNQDWMEGEKKRRGWFERLGSSFQEGRGGWWLVSVLSVPLVPVWAFSPSPVSTPLGT